LEARLPFFVVPSVSQDAASVVSAALPANGFFVGLNPDIIVTMPSDLEQGALLNATVSLENGSQVYSIEDIQYLGFEETIGVRLRVNGAIKTSILSWAEQGGFSVTITEAQP
jgi:hypothetical protein